MQAVMNNLKFINLDCVAGKKSVILDWRRDFCDWFRSSPFIWKVMCFIPGHKSTIHSRIILCTSTLNTDQQTETVVPRRALSVVFSVMSYVHVWRNNRLYAISQLLTAVAAVVSSYHNSKPSLVIVSTPVLRLKSCQIFPWDQSVHFKNTTVSKYRKIRIARCEKSKFYPVLVKSRIKKSG